MYLNYRIFMRSIFNQTVIEFDNNMYGVDSIWYLLNTKAPSLGFSSWIWDYVSRPSDTAIAVCCIQYSWSHNKKTVCLNKPFCVCKNLDGALKQKTGYEYILNIVLVFWVWTKILSSENNVDEEWKLGWLKWNGWAASREHT